MSNNKVEQVEERLKEIMEILEIPYTESSKNTPHRIAKMWVNELFVNVNDAHLDELKESMTLFPNEYTSEMIVVKDIDFNSVCEHHFLPFSGKVSIGYVPDKSIIGLSKLPRVVKYFSKRPQLQEKFTGEIGEFLLDLLKPKALFILVEATHQCVKCRGAESDCSTITSYTRCISGYDVFYNDFKEKIKG